MCTVSRLALPWHLDGVSAVSGPNHHCDFEGRTPIGTRAPGYKCSGQNLLHCECILLQQSLELCSCQAQHVAHLLGRHPLNIFGKINSWQQLAKSGLHHGCSCSTSGFAALFVAATCHAESCYAQKANILATVAASPASARLHQAPLLRSSRACLGPPKFLANNQETRAQSKRTLQDCHATCHTLLCGHDTSCGSVDFLP